MKGAILFLLSVVSALAQATFSGTLSGTATMTAFYPPITGMTTQAWTISGTPAQILIPSPYYPNTLKYNLVVYHNGHGEDQTAPVTDTNKLPITLAIVTNGCFVASIAAGNNWGDSAALALYSNLVYSVTNNYPCTRKAVFWGQSMGGLTSCLAVSSFTNIVKGLAEIYPIINLYSAYTNVNFNIASNEINTVYNIPTGGTYAAQTAGHDPALFAGSYYSGLRIRSYASYADTIAYRVANADTLYAIALGFALEDNVETCTGQHGDLSCFQESDFISFIQRCFQ